MINLFTLPLITIFLLSLQAIFAGSEIALLSCDKAKIREKADSGNSAAKLVTQSINRIEEYVSTSLVGENLCIVINTALVSLYIKRNYPEYDPHLISVLILTPLIVIFGQVVPKSIFQKQSNYFVLKTIYFSIFFSIVFKPLLALVKLMTDTIVKILGTTGKLITREELIHAIEVESNVEMPSTKVGEFDVELAREFFQSFTNNLKANIHIETKYGTNNHHIIESIFKSIAKSLDVASAYDSRSNSIPSTKGNL